MRTKIAAAAFVLIGGGASTIAALDPPINMQGSDTLFLLSQQVINVCPKTPGGSDPPLGINYIGTGSSNGQRNTLKTCLGTVVSPAAHTITPMSRFLNRDNATAANDICQCNQAHGAEGINFALDGVGIISNTTTAPDACGGVAQAGKVIALDGGGTYTLADTFDAIRVAWFGVLNTDPTGATPQCGGVVRRSLLSTYSNFFNGTCPAGAGDTACPTGIRHLWRRDGGSGTSDVFAALVNPGPGSAAVNRFCNVNGGLTTLPGQALGGTNKNFFDYQDADPYRITCNGNGFTTGEQVCGDAGQAPPPGSLTRRTPPIGAAAWLPGGQCIRAKRACVVNDDCRDFTGDTDTCVTGRCVAKHLECNVNTDCTAVVAGDFCGRHGTLGMLLSIFIPDTVDVPPAEIYPIGLCTAGVNSLLPASKSTYTGPCPSGSPSFGGRCFSSMFRPATGPLNANCITGFSGTRCPTLTPAGTDCRGANAWMRNPVGDLVVDSSIPATRTAPPVPPAGRFMLGAFFRIHATTRMPNGTASCARPSATEQIGCLASIAAPCSMGYAGRSAADIAPANLQDVGGVDNSIPNIQNLVSGAGPVYPLARKLYLNTLTNFDTVTGQELQMAKCFATESIINPIIDANSFVQMPVVGSRQVQCTDFDETTAGCTGAPVNACATNPAPIPTFP